MKIEIRRAKPGDEKKTAAMINEGIKRKTWIYTNQDKIISEREVRKWRKKYKKNSNFILFIALDKNTGDVVGTGSFNLNKRKRVRHITSLGWGIRPGYEKKGIASKLIKKVLSEAKKRGIKKTEAEIVEKNIPSLKLAKKLGFKIEGKKEKAFMTDDGKLNDVYVVGKVLK
ncbi:GNAT family N-acetyltransferase [Candidatus Pacearchaeota archaeon]|nr:GNAT family N-acetyltransferase [Candidatus Pacearchaeota archaeon]